MSAGTPLPKGLAIIKDNYNSRLGAYHYTIAPAYNMPLTVFKLLLNQLAKSVVKEVA
ncbi:Tse2 family ADP-ribosyltransferase toxin [Pseudoalteromonas sp. N1230-9]|uniref:Tse2 family ADP-ribosyltransferase toxin n=1 Tax=Pseudoalteromonas sp. N1230-9 TaxID=2907156 RepID=UPI004054278B